MKRLHGFAGILLIALAVGWWFTADDAQEAPSDSTRRAQPRRQLDREFLRANWDTTPVDSTRDEPAENIADKKPARLQGAGVVTFVAPKNRVNR